jgi:hypothetical protein
METSPELHKPIHDSRRLDNSVPLAQGDKIERKERGKKQINYCCNALHATRGTIRQNEIRIRQINCGWEQKRFSRYQ